MNGIGVWHEVQWRNNSVTCGIKSSIKLDIVDCSADILILNAGHLCWITDNRRRCTMLLIKMPSVGVFSNKTDGIACMIW